MSPLRAVLLDAGGTLFTERSSRASIYAAAARRHGLIVDEAATARAMREVHARLPRRLDGAGGAFRYSRRWFERFIAEVFAGAGAASLPEGLAPDLFATFSDPSTFRLFDEVLPVLSCLRGEGIRLAVVSNWSPALPELLKGLGLAPFLDAAVVSAVEEVEKPEPEIFTRALRRLGVGASEALHVGDDPVRDLAGAKSAGIAAQRLDRSATDPTAWASLTPLAELVKTRDRLDPEKPPRGRNT